MILEQFKEEIKQYNFEEKEAFLKDCLEYLDGRTGILDDLYHELISSKYDTLEELVYSIDSKEEVARAIYFGNIKNWNDTHFFFNAYGNIESENDYEYYKRFINYKETILKEMIEFIDEEEFKKINNIDELIKYITKKML